MKTVVLTWTCIVLVILAVFISLWVIFFFWIGFGVAVALSLLFTLPYIKGVPSGEEWNTEVFNKYYRTLKPGPRLLTPFCEKLASEVSTKTEERQLFVEKDEMGNPRLMKIDFKDTSAAVEAKFYFHYSDSHKATYAATDPESLTIGLLEKRFRTILSPMTVDEANESKDTLEEKIAPTKFIRRIASKWGLTIDEVVLSDIKLSAEDLASRRSILDKEKELERTRKDEKIAEVKQRIKAKDAKGDTHIIVETGKALAGQIKELKDTAKLSAEDAAAYLTSQKKWEAIQKNDGTTIIDNTPSNNPMHTGLRFGTGFGASKKKGAKP